MTDKHEHLDEGTIHAWLDGALSPDEAARVEAQASACADCAALVAEARGLVAASSRILSSLDAIPGGVIPGTDGVDQLAKLRAARRVASHRWWTGRRIVAAASLVFVAGVTSVVWRFAGTETVTSPTEQTVDAVQPFADSARSIVTAPPASAPVAGSDARARGEAKAEALAALRETAPVQATVAKVADSTTDMKKVAAANTPLPRAAEVAANEARRTDSIVAGRQAILDSVGKRDVVERSAFEKQQVQQQGATQNEQVLRQRAAATPPVAPPASFAARDRLGAVVTTGVGAAAAMERMARCYQLRPAMPQARSGIVADSVQLLTETIPERSDPTWFRARAVGFADSALIWRSVDSTTVELRSRVASTPLVIRFNTTASGLPLPDPGREPGVRAALAVRMRCP